MSDATYDLKTSLCVEGPMGSLRRCAVGVLGLMTLSAIAWLLILPFVFMSLLIAFYGQEDVFSDPLAWALLIAVVYSPVTLYIGNRRFWRSFRHASLSRLYRSTLMTVSGPYLVIVLVLAYEAMTSPCLVLGRLGFC